MQVVVFIQGLKRMDKRNTKEVGRKMPSIPRRFHLLLFDGKVIWELKFTD